MIYCEDNMSWNEFIFELLNIIILIVSYFEFKLLFFVLVFLKKYL